MFPTGSQYKFIKEIGSTGVVNLAIDNHSGYQVAIKPYLIFIKNAEILNKFKIELTYTYF